MNITELDRLSTAIPHGSSNATNVAALATETGFAERQVRQGIQELRRLGMARVALPTRNGVYVATADDVDALKRTRDGLHSRAMSALVTAKYLDHAIERIEFSPTLFA